MGVPKQKWTRDEETALKAGVAKHGAGKWRKILKDLDFSGVLHLRSNIDLKDKWRNMSVTANRCGSRRKNILVQNESPMALSTGVNIDDVAIDAFPLAVSYVSTPNGRPQGSIKRLNGLIVETVSSLKEPGSSNTTNIAALIEVASNRPEMKTPTQAAKTPLRPAHGSPKMTPLKKKTPIKKKTPMKKTLKGGRRTSTRVQNQGHYDIILPQVPTVDECFLHYFMTRQPVPEMYKKPDLRPPFNKDLLVHIDNGLAVIAKSYAWQLEAPYLLGDTMMDSMSRILHLAERNRSDGENKIWFLPSLYSPLGQKNANSGISTLYLGEFDKMRWIALPLNITDLHYLLMVLDFTEKKVFIMDPSSKQLYNDSAIGAKLIQMHLNLEIALPAHYPNFFDITKWEIVWTRPNIPRQSNEFDCGAYVCFYMAHLRELIPEPQQIIKVQEDYIRIWLANYIGRSVYNNIKETLLEQSSLFKADRANEDEFSLKYKKIPSVYQKYLT